MHHLLIMEALGGNERFEDKFIAQHIAFFYYWIVVVLYAFFPAIAYNLNQYVEEHAYETYTAFIANSTELLRSLPAPQVAIDYYNTDALFLDATNHRIENFPLVSDDVDDRTPPIVERPLEVNSLLDVFNHIRADEAEHARTMQALQRELVPGKGFLI